MFDSCTSCSSLAFPAQRTLFMILPLLCQCFVLGRIVPFSASALTHHPISRLWLKPFIRYCSHFNSPDERPLCLLSGEWFVAWLTCCRLQENGFIFTRADTMNECNGVRKASRSSQLVILETMSKGHSPGQLPGWYMLHDCMVGNP